MAGTAKHPSETILKLHGTLYNVKVRTQHFKFWLHSHLTKTKLTAVNLICKMAHSSTLQAPVLT